MFSARRFSSRFSRQINKYAFIAGTKYFARSRRFRIDSIFFPVWTAGNNPAVDVYDIRLNTPVPIPRYNPSLGRGRELLSRRRDRLINGGEISIIPNTPRSGREFEFHFASYPDVNYNLCPRPECNSARLFRF